MSLTHSPTSMRNLAALESDRRFGRKLTMVGVHPDGSTLTLEGIAMQSILNLGADVDSRYVMVACAAGSFKPQRIANEPKAIRAWLRTVPRGSRLAMESTGSYHELFADLAHQAGLQVFIVNARDLRRYGQGIGRRGKTDRIDAEVIARYLAREHEELHAYVPPSDEQRMLTRLIGRRCKARTGEGSIRQSLGGLPACRAKFADSLANDRVICEPRPADCNAQCSRCRVRVRRLDTLRRSRASVCSRVLVWAIASRGCRMQRAMP